MQDLINSSHPNSHLTRLCFQRGLAFIYLIGFLILVDQGPGREDHVDAYWKDQDDRIYLFSQSKMAREAFEELFLATFGKPHKLGLFRLLPPLLGMHPAAWQNPAENSTFVAFFLEAFLAAFFLVDFFFATTFGGFFLAGFFLLAAAFFLGGLRFVHAFFGVHVSSKVFS